MSSANHPNQIYSGEILYRVIAYRRWLKPLNPDRRLNINTYMRRVDRDKNTGKTLSVKEDDLSFIRKASVPTCEDIHASNIGESYGLESLTVEEIRNTPDDGQQSLVKLDAVPDSSRKAHVDVPDPIVESDKAEDVSVALLKKSKEVNRDRCRNVDPKRP